MSSYFRHFRSSSPSLTALCALLVACQPQTETDIVAPEIHSQRSTVETGPFHEAQAIGNDFEDEPWIAHVLATDLDQDGWPDIIACEARLSQVVWLKGGPGGQFEESLLAADLKAPVHAEAVDLDADGDLDVLVSSMGFVYPNNDRIGYLYVLENDGQQNFTKRSLLENVARVTDARAGDFNGDGQLDIAIAQFGYDQGEVQWLERVGPWRYESHKLLDLSGAINVCLADMNGNGALDIVALMSQQWEEVYLFENDGHGSFESKIIFGSTNEEFNSSGISLSDMNQDGLMDVLYTNGDGFGPTALPGPRPWHGVHWLENQGQGQFRHHLIGRLPGAYSPVGTDLDSDGSMDVVAVSSFNDWTDPQAESLVWFRNDGAMDFTPISLSHKPTHLLGLAVADFDQNGTPSIATGGFHAYPPYEHMSRLLLWRNPTSQ